MHESCSLCYHDDSPYICYLSIFSNLGVTNSSYSAPPFLHVDSSISNDYFSNVSPLDQNLLMSAADSLIREQHGADKKIP